METAIISLFTTAMMIFATVALVMSAITSFVGISDSFQAIDKQAGIIQATMIDISYVDIIDDVIILNIHNNGQVDLKNYSAWTLLAEYQDGPTVYLAYSESAPSGNEWSIDSFWMGASQPEVFDPMILNPGEFMTLHLNLDPPLNPGQSLRITASTPAGVTAQCQITAPLEE